MTEVAFSGPLNRTDTSDREATALNVKALGQISEARVRQPYESLTVEDRRSLHLRADLRSFRDGSSPLSVPEHPDSSPLEENPNALEDQPALSEAERLARSSQEYSQKNGPSNYGVIR